MDTEPEDEKTDPSQQVLALVLQTSSDSAKAVGDCAVALKNLEDKVDQLVVEMRVRNELTEKIEKNLEARAAVRFEMIRSVWTWMTSSVDFKTIGIVLIVLASDRCSSSGADKVLAYVGLGQ